MSNTSSKQVMSFRLFHHQQDDKNTKNQDDLSVLNELGEPSMPQLPGHSFADDDDDDQQELGDYASYYNDSRRPPRNSIAAASSYGDPVIINVANAGQDNASSSCSIKGEKSFDELQEQPQDEEFGKQRVDAKNESHDDGSSRRARKENDSLPTNCCYVVGGVIILLILVLVGMITAIGFVAVHRSSSTSNNNNNTVVQSSASTNDTSLPTIPTNTRCSTVGLVQLHQHHHPKRQLQVKHCPPVPPHVHPLVVALQGPWPIPNVIQIVSLMTTVPLARLASRP
jgi:hypothetical protein